MGSFLDCCISTWILHFKLMFEFCILLFFSSEIMKMFFILLSNFSVWCFWVGSSVLIFNISVPPFRHQLKATSWYDFHTPSICLIFKVLDGFACSIAHRSPLLHWVFSYLPLYFFFSSICWNSMISRAWESLWGFECIPFDLVIVLWLFKYTYWKGCLVFFLSDGAPSALQDAFLDRLSQADATESSCSCKSFNQMEEDRGTTIEKTRKIVGNVIAAIDNQWRVKDALHDALVKVLPEDGESLD